MTFVASHIIPCVCSLFVTTLSPEERHEYLNFDLHFYLPLYILEANVELFYLLHLCNVPLQVRSAAILFIHQADSNKKEKH